MNNPYLLKLTASSRQAVFFAKNISALSFDTSKYRELRHEVNFWSSMYFMLGFTAFLGWLGQGICFAYCSERLVHRTRDLTFRTIIHQDIRMFDKAEFSAGSSYQLFIDGSYPTCWNEWRYVRYDPCHINYLSSRHSLIGVHWLETCPRLYGDYSHTYWLRPPPTQNACAAGEKIKGGIRGFRDLRV